MSNEIQKDDVILPGGLGSVTIGSTGQAHQVTAIENKSDGSVTITLGAVVQKYLDKKANIEDAEYEIIQPKQIKNGTGS